MNRILAVASAGGHWVQLMRLRPAFDGPQTTFVSTDRGYSEALGRPVIQVVDANLDRKWMLVCLFVQMAWLIIRHRPSIILTTGAAPGFAALSIGKLLGAKTVWIDSIANSEELSRSGRAARRWADLWLTQWPHLATERGPQYWGNVL